MKLCTKVRVSAAQVGEGVTIAGDAEIIDISFVPDDHEFGVMADGTLHIEAQDMHVHAGD